jgi:hypothetical protein
VDALVGAKRARIRRKIERSTAPFQSKPHCSRSGLPSTCHIHGNEEGEVRTGFIAKYPTRARAPGDGQDVQA